MSTSGSSTHAHPPNPVRTSRRRIGATRWNRVRSRSRTSEKRSVGGVAGSGARINVARTCRCWVGVSPSRRARSSSLSGSTRQHGTPRPTAVPLMVVLWTSLVTAGRGPHRPQPRRLPTPLGALVLEATTPGPEDVGTCADADQPVASQDGYVIDAFLEHALEHSQHRVVGRHRDPVSYTHLRAHETDS